MPVLTEQTVDDIIRLVEEALEDITERMREDVGEAPVYEDEDKRRSTRTKTSAGLRGRRQAPVSGDVRPSGRCPADSAGSAGTAYHRSRPTSPHAET
jgi:hypothetical protein